MALKIHDASSISNRGFLDEIAAAGEAAGVKFQYSVLPRGGTDAGAIQRSRERRAHGDAGDPDAVHPHGHGDDPQGRFAERDRPDRGVAGGVSWRYNASMAEPIELDSPKYTITDGKLVLDIYDCDDETGYFAVQGTFDRSLLTQGRTLKEVFEMAHDAAAMLEASRRKDHECRHPQEEHKPARKSA